MGQLKSYQLVTDDFLLWIMINLQQARTTGRLTIVYKVNLYKLWWHFDDFPRLRRWYMHAAQVSDDSAVIRWRIFWQGKRDGKWRFSVNWKDKKVWGLGNSPVTVTLTRNNFYLCMLISWALSIDWNLSQLTPERVVHVKHRSRTVC